MKDPNDMVNQTLAVNEATNSVHDKVLEMIEVWVEKEYRSLRGIENEDVISLIELEFKETLSGMDTSFFERKYIEIVLQVWQKESQRNAFSYIENEKKDISQEMPNLLKQLDLLESLKDLKKLKELDSTSPVLQWCDEKRLEMIYNQDELFEDVPYVIQQLVSSYFEQFKTSCIDKLFLKCSEGNSESQSNFIETLNDFLSLIDSWIERKNILESVKNQLVDDSVDGREFIEAIINSCHEHIQTTSTDCDPVKEVKEFINNNDCWTSNFKTLTKEICKRHLLPLTTIEKKEDCGRRILIIKSSVIRISEIKLEMEEQMTHFKAEQVQIIGLSAVYIDCNLDQQDWHGMNVVVITNNLFVDGQVIWNVSGKDGQLNRQEAKANNDGIDGLAGEHGRPGESGGNVRVTYNKLISSSNLNPGDWKIVSNGGRGNAGQDGGDGSDALQDGSDATCSKPSLKEFEGFFGDCSKISIEKAIKSGEFKNQLKISEKALQDFISKEANSFFIKIHTDNGVEIILSHNQGHSLILWKGEEGEAGQMGGRGGQGGKGGLGGYGGKIDIQKRTENNKLTVLDNQNKIGDNEITATITTSSVRGEDGCAGKDGKGGQSGKRGKSIGDVGFIKHMGRNISNWRHGANYFGFDTESTKFNLRYHPADKSFRNDELNSEPYTMCRLDGRVTRDHYAVLYTIEDSQDLRVLQIAKKIDGRHQEVMQEAVRKKAIVEQSLVHHFVDIDKRKNMNQFLIRLKDKTSVLTLQSNCQRSLRSSQAISSLVKITPILCQKSVESRHVPPDTKRTREITSNNSSLSVDSQLQVISEDDKKEMKILEEIDKDSTCQDAKAEGYVQFPDYLVPQPTNFDNHSILHAALGEINQNTGLYDCSNDIKKFKKEIKEECKRIIKMNGSHMCKRSIRETNEQAAKAVDSISFDEMIEGFILRLADDDDTNSFENGKKIKDLYFKEELKARNTFWKSINQELEKCELAAKIQNNEILSKTYQELSLEDKVMHLLRHALDDEDIKSIDTKACQEIRQLFMSLLNNTIKKHIEGMNNKRGWQVKLKSFEDWEKEYKIYMKKEKLGLVELRIIDKKIHYFIYENFGTEYYDLDYSENLPTLKCIIKSSAQNKCYLLNRGNGVWQRLNIDPKLKKYCDDLVLQKIKRYNHFNKPNNKENALSTLESSPVPNSKHLEAHQFLLKWLRDKTEIPTTILNKMMTSVEMFNPEYGCTPGELSKLISNKLLDKKITLDEQLAKDIGLLAERVVDYDIRNVDPIFYLSVVENSSPHRWKYEFILLDMENSMKLVLEPEKRAKWRRNLYQLDEKILDALRKRLQIVAVTELGSPPLKQDRLEKALEMLASGLPLTSENITHLGYLSLNDWVYELKIKMWEKEVNELINKENKKGDHLMKGEKKEAVYLLLELENKKGEDFVREHLKSVEGKKFSEILKEVEQELTTDGHLIVDSNKKNERNLEIIIKMIQSETGGNTSKSIADKLDSIKICIEDIENDLKSNNGSTSFSLKSLDDIKKWAKDFRLIVNRKDDQNNIKKFLLCYIRAVQLVSHSTKKKGLLLRHTQRVAIMNLLLNENNTLAQVSTGEGKSLIVAGVAIYRALSGKKVDVITSNNVLAKRDSSLSMEEGGLQNLYQVFDINVAHNCNENEDDRIRAYDSAVVYGELSNFQRDYLLDKCYGHNIRGDRTFDYVIVDEVDCMLLDRGNNMLYLTHDIPGMEMLESLYVFIWEKIRTGDAQADIKSAILYDLYGAITADDLSTIDVDLENDWTKKYSLWNHLIERNIIDKQGRVQISLDEVNEDKFDYKSELNPKLAFFFRKVLDRERLIRIPKHLLPFVDRHLDTFVNNAERSLMLNADEHYVVDHNRSSGSSLDLNPQVIIIDPDTGTDQTTSQWDGALHQFLQLKEGCRLTLQGLKSVFISNVTFIKRYEKLAGLTGTLGSQPEREFLQDIYRCDYFTVPTAFPKNFKIKPAIVLKTQEKWLQTIVEETHQIVFEEKRSLVIFCRTIQLVKTVYTYLKPIFDSKNIRSYTRDYENFSIETKNQSNVVNHELGVGQLIVATNLAGRGTDIKTSEELNKNGGLHICLTYLPENVRIEEQAMGRAGRKGDPGSGRLILYEQDSDETSSKWPKDQIFDMKEERNRQELLRISRLSEDFLLKVVKQENCFKFFWENYEQLKNKLIKEAEKEESKTSQEVDMICNSLLDRWALWLDQVDDGHNFESLPSEKLLERLKNELFDKVPSDKDILDWVTPDRSIVLAKYLTIKENITKIDKVNQSVKLKKKISKLEKAAELLNSLIQSKDSFLYPAAHYYRAMLYIKEEDGLNKKNKNDFIRMLRATKTILEQNIEMQISFSLTVDQFQTERNHCSFYDIDAYKKQKENIVQLLRHYINSIHSMLGSHCSVKDLQEAGVSDEETAKKYFSQLVNLGCIVNCQVNDKKTVPDREKSLERIAKDYGVDLITLETFLNKATNPISEEKMKKELENTDMIRCTRRKFWNYLVDQGVLLKPQESSDVIDSSSIYILFDPTPDNIHCFLERKKHAQDIEYAKLQMPIELDTNDLKVFGDPVELAFKNDIKSIDLTIFGKLTKSDDLIAADITNETEREIIWEALIDEKIVNENGKLSSDYMERMDGLFRKNYPQLHIYENAIKDLIERTYIADLVRHQWLVKEQNPVQRMKWIAYLPLDTYEDMLCHLQSAHIISGNTVTDIIYGTDLKNEIKKITDCLGEQSRIFSFLDNHQADYADMEHLKVSLLPILSYMRKTTDNEKTIDAMIPELYSLNIIGFNHVIEMSEKKFWIRLQCGFMITVGVLSMALALIPPISAICTWAANAPSLFGKNKGLANAAVPFLLAKGLGSIVVGVSALKSGEYLRWGDYFRRISNAPEKKFMIDVAIRAWNFIKKKEKRKANVEEIKTKIVKEITSSNRITITQSMEFERLNGKIEYYIKVEFGFLFRQLKDDLENKIRDIVKNYSPEIKTTLKNLHLGTQNTKWLVKKTLQQITSKWEDIIQLWLTKILAQAPSIRDDESQDQESSLEDRIVRNIKNVLENSEVTKILAEVIQKQITNLNETLKTNEISNLATITDQEKEILQEQILEYISSSLRETAEKIMKWLKETVLKKAAYQHINGLSTAGRKPSHVGKPVNNKSEDGHIKVCLKLMKLTKNTNLLAAMIREGVELDDPFFNNGKLHAFQHISKEVQKKPEEVAKLIETDQSIAKAIRVGWRKFTQQKCPFELYPDGELFPGGGIGCPNEDCELRGLSDYVGYRTYVKEAFVGTSDVNSFNIMQKHYKKRNDKQSTIWLYMTTFMFPIVKRLVNGDRKKEFIVAAGKHLDKHYQEELKKRLQHCVG